MNEDELAPVEPGPGVRRFAWAGAKKGWVGASKVLGPFVVVGSILELMILAFSVGTGRGVGLWTPLIRWIGGFLSLIVICGLLGGVLGGVIGLFVGVFPQGAGRAGWAALSRPIRVMPLWLPGGRLRRGLAGWFRTNWMWILGVPTVTLVVLALGAGIYLGQWVDRELAEAIAATDRDDPNWRLGDLMATREAISHEENSAIVVANVVDRIGNSWPGPPPRPGGGRVERRLLESAYESIKTTPEAVRLEEWAATRMREELLRLEEAVRQARGVAEYRRGRHELIIGRAVIDTPLAGTQDSRAVVQLLAADAAVLANDGDIDGSLDSCRAIFGVARSIGDEPYVISQLVRIFYGTVGIHAALRTLAQGEGTEDRSLAELQAVLLMERDEPLICVGMRGERASYFEVIRRIRDEEMKIDEFVESVLEQSVSSDSFVRVPPVAPWLKLSYDHQMALTLNWMDELLGIVEKTPTWEWLAQVGKLDYELTRRRVEWHSRFTAAIPLLMMPATTSSVWGELRYRADLSATAILIAAERQRRRTGAWPESVEAIDPAILPHPPLDPFSGDSYRMSFLDGELRIYSVGPNGRDEGGRYNARKRVNSRSTDEDDQGATGWDVRLRGAPAFEEGE